MLFITAVVLAIFAAFYFMSPAKRLKRRLKKLPQANRIIDTPENQDVRVSGTLVFPEGQEPLKAPLSGRPCAAWHVVVEEADDDNWRVMVSDSHSVDFILEDESGRALVDGTLLKFALNFDAKDTQGVIKKATPELQAFVESRGESMRGIVLKKTIRAREGVLEEGERVSVGGQGVFVRDPQAKQGYRGSAKLLRVGPLSSGELLVTDELE